jgi:MFS family permease
LPWLVAVAFFMQSLDTTILNTAVPVVAQALHVSPLAMKSVLASYTLGLAVFIPISGCMADRIGACRVFSSAHGFHAVSKNYPLLQPRLFAIQRFARPSAEASSRASASAAYRFCCPCCIKWASVLRRCNPGC